MITLEDKFSETKYGKLALTAKNIAEEAAELIRDRRAQLGRERLGVETKASITDPVTIIDRESETLIRTRLAQLRPGDSVLGEENVEGITPQTNLSDTRWIVDPIDGTANFLYNAPAFAVSIACEVEAEIVAGAVVDIPHGATYVAAKNQGAYLVSSQGIRKLCCNRPASLQTSMVATGFSCMKTRRERQSQIFAQLIGNIRDLRRFGAAALDCCRVADGTVDAYYEHGISGWDYAAGQLVAKEAGAYVHIPSVDTDSHQGELTFIAAPTIANELASALKKTEAWSAISED